jgi:hypothetical protein
MSTENDLDISQAPDELIEWFDNESGIQPLIKNDNPTLSLSIRVRETLRLVLATLDGSRPDIATQLIERILKSTRALRRLSTKEQHIYAGVFEVLLHECSVTESGSLHLDQLPIATEYSDDVRAELFSISSCARKGSLPKDPHAHWQGLVESVQRSHTRTSAMKLVEAIDEKMTVAELMARFKDIEPPTTKKAVVRKGAVRTAKSIATQFRFSTAGQLQLRFSSGMPTLDKGYTNPGEVVGFIAPGQFVVVMGPTGTGKTSFANTVTPSFGLDLLNYGLPDAKQVLFHTEEESIDKLRGFRMDVGQKFHHLADNLVIDAIGTSRRRMAETLYDLIIDADERSRSTKRPITDFLPYIVQLDYIQSISEAGEDEVKASAITAEFLLRGVSAWNPDELSKFSGVDFREYSGTAWPNGMEEHRVAVIGYAQLVKVSDETMFYKEGKRGMQMSDFALLDGTDTPYWEVRENDLRLFGKNQMRGSGVIANNAHAIVILHRSIPYKNPSIKGPDNKMHLSDTRARILFDKSRAGSQLPYAPMRFDVQSNGFRAQYFDELAERAISEGKLTNYDPACRTEWGDPIIPRRKRLSLLEATRY